MGAILRGCNPTVTDREIDRQAADRQLEGGEGG